METPKAVQADCLGMAVPEIKDLGLAATGSDHQQQSEKNRPEARRGPDKHRRDGVTPGHAAQLKSVNDDGRTVLGMDRFAGRSMPNDTIARALVERGTLQ